MMRGLSRRRVRSLLYTTAWRLQALRLPLPRRTVGIASLVLLALAASWLAPPPHTASSAPHPSTTPTAVVTTSTKHPSEAAVTSYHSTATGDQPKYLHLPTIRTEGYVQAVGVDQHRQVAVPTNIHLAGWFASSVTPGNPGLSIIDGHLDGYRHPGLFADLDKLKIGDHFSVDLANGQTRTFRVKTIQSLPTNQAAAALFSQIPGITHQLNLITCGGTFSTGSGYNQRVVIAAELIPTPK